MRYERLPVIIGAATGVLGLALAVHLWWREPGGGGARSGAPSADAVQVTPARHPRSARVEERLQLLREAYQREGGATAEAPPPAADVTAPGGGQAPPRPDQEAAGQPIEIKRGIRENWRHAAPVPQAAPAPQVRRGPHDPDPVHHAGYPTQAWDVNQLEETILNGTDPVQRKAALSLLGGEEPGDALRVLSAALEANDPDPAMRAAVVAAFDDYGDDVAPNVLAGALHDESPEVRFEAVSVLGGMDSPEARKLVAGAANDPDPDVRDLARGILELSD